MDLVTLGRGQNFESKNQVDAEGRCRVLVSVSWHTVRCGLGSSPAKEASARMRRVEGRPAEALGFEVQKNALRAPWKCGITNAYTKQYLRELNAFCQYDPDGHGQKNVCVEQYLRKTNASYQYHQTKTKALEKTDVADDIGVLQNARGVHYTSLRMIQYDPEDYAQKNVCMEQYQPAEHLRRHARDDR